MDPDLRVLELLPVIQASGSGTLGRASERLEYRYEQKQRSCGDHPNTARNATTDVDDVLACVAVNANLSFEQVANPSKDQLAEIYNIFVHMVDDLEVARFRLRQMDDNRSLSRFDEQMVHCVRCHQNYELWKNGKRACRVLHNDDIEAEMVDSRRGVWHDWVWPCNGTVVRSGYEDCPPDHKYCFIGRHTSNPAEVCYTNEIRQSLGSDLYDESDTSQESEDGDDDDDHDEGKGQAKDAISDSRDEPRAFPTCKQAGCDKPEGRLLRSRKAGVLAK